MASGFSVSFGADTSDLLTGLQDVTDDLQTTIASFDQVARSAADAGAAMTDMGNQGAAAMGRTASASQQTGAALQKTAKQWQQSFAPIGTAFDTLLGAMISGTKNWQKTVTDAFLKMATSFAENIAKMLAQWALFGSVTDKGPIANLIGGALPSTGGGLTSFLGMGGAGGGDAVKAGDETANTTALTANTTALGTLAAAMTANTAALEAGSVGGASPFGGDGIEGVFDTISMLPGFDVGSWSVPGDMVARIHQGEMIIPAGPAQSMRDGAMFSAGGPGGAGGAVHLHIHAIDPRTGAQWLMDNKHHVAAAVHGAWRNGNPRMR